MAKAVSGEGDELVLAPGPKVGNGGEEPAARRRDRLVVLAAGPPRLVAEPRTAENRVGVRVHQPGRHEAAVAVHDFARPFAQLGVRRYQRDAPVLDADADAVRDAEMVPGGTPDRARLRGTRDHGRGVDEGESPGGPNDRAPASAGGCRAPPRARSPSRTPRPRGARRPCPD